MLNKSFYTTILCQSFSPCGKYLVAGSTYGQIAVFDIDKALHPDSESNIIGHNKAKHIFVVERDVPITALASTQQHLIVGCNGEISGWDWKTVTGYKSTKHSWSIKIPLKKNFMDVVDVNSLWVDETNEQLIAGCGDNNLYSFSLEGGKLLRTYEGHEDYVHHIHGLNNQLISCGEDGLLKVWDLRDKCAHATLAPYKDDKICRSDLGKWLGAAELSSDWIICGGGPRASLWHLRAMEAATIFDLPNNGIHVASFLDESVVIAGTARHLYHVNYTGDIVVQLPVSATTVYSAICQSTLQRIFTVAGSSPDIDICTSFNYRDQVLHFAT